MAWYHEDKKNYSKFAHHSGIYRMHDLKTFTGTQNEGQGLVFLAYFLSDIKILCSVYTYPNILLKNGDCFLRFNVPSTQRRFREPKTQVFKNSSQGEDFWKRRLLFFVWTDKNLTLKP